MRNMIGVLWLLSAAACSLASLEVVHEKLYEGCYPDDPQQRDLERFIWSKDDVNDVESCIIACRQHGYVYAGLQAGTECWCSNNLVRQSNATDDSACDVTCPGSVLETCGGVLTNSVYNVPWDSRSVGCWELNHDDLHDFRWSHTAHRSAEQCIDECRQQGYWYAGVHEGGSCHCGDTYGGGAGEEELACRSVPCTGGYAEQACGGEEQQAVYMTELAVNLPAASQLNTRRIYYDDPNFNGIQTRLFVTFPDLRSVISPRLSIHVTEDVEAVMDGALPCDDDCYEPCGEIYHVDGLQNTGETLVLRFFHIKLSQLHEYVGEDVQQLYLYAQTVIVDQSINVPYTLLIRARNMMIDHTAASYITVSSTAPVLDVDMEEAKQRGIPADILFQKQSYMCARILIDTRTPDYIWKALAIVYDLGMDDTYSDEEQQGWTYAMRMYRAEILGLERYDIHFIPFYTKSFLADVLGIYYEDLLLYKQAFDTMMDRNTDREQHLQAVTTMLTINQDTNIYQAEREYEMAVRGVERSRATYEMLYEQYSITRMRMEDAQTVFLENLKEYQSKSVVRATIDFVDAMKKMVLGSVLVAYGAVERGMSLVMSGIEGMADAMKNLADTISKLDSMMAVMDEMLEKLEDIEANADMLQYMGDVEMTVQLQMAIVKWQVLKDQAYKVLVHSDIITIQGCTEYRVHVLDLCNWGEALTRSLVDLAENMRECVKQRYILTGKYEQQERYSEYLEELEADSSRREAMTVAMAQQEYDIRLDLNEILLTFCQTYFYEDLRECSAALKPKFGGSLTELLTKVNLARNDGIFLPGGGGSTISRYVDIIDMDVSANCSDAVLCPVRVFRQTGMLYLPLPMGRHELDDLDKFRVREIVLDFVGAAATTSNKLLKVSIMASGTFQCRYSNTVYDFLSRALGLAYEYNIESKYISIHADVYEPFRNIVNHVTPYTTWIIELDELRSADIDLSRVTSVRMRLDGTAVIKYTEETLPEY